MVLIAGVTTERGTSGADETSTRMIDAFKRVPRIAPLIQTVRERPARMIDAFKRVPRIAPLIQTVLERPARMIDAFK